MVETFTQRKRRASFYSSSGKDLREGMGSEGQVRLITQNHCFHNTKKPRLALSFRLKLVQRGVSGGDSVYVACC